MIGHEHGTGRQHRYRHSPPRLAVPRDRLGLILAFMAVEVVVGIIASSLALISDAGHMLTDAAAIALALIAARLAARPAAGNLTYGWKRVEILSAQANGITLWLLAAWFLYEGDPATDRPARGSRWPGAGDRAGRHCREYDGVLADRPGRPHLLNVEGAFQHILNDLFAFIATAVAGLVILLPAGPAPTPSPR